MQIVRTEMMVMNAAAVIGKDGLTAILDVCWPHESSVEPGFELPQNTDGPGGDSAAPPDSRSPVSLVMLQVDHFGSFVHTFGVHAGLQVMSRASTVIAEHSREGDQVVPYADARFAVVLPRTDAPGAVALAERYRAKIESGLWPLPRLTASIGVASMSTEIRDVISLIHEAERALHHAELSGHNRVSHIQVADRPSNMPLPASDPAIRRVK